MAGPDPLLPWIAAAVRAAREEADRKQVHIAAERGMTEESIRKFEQARRWPRDPDAMVHAYAQDLDVPELELWKDAIRRWEESTQ